MIFAIVAMNVMVQVSRRTANLVVFVMVRDLKPNLSVERDAPQAALPLATRPSLSR